jgi:hypothetical protein
VLPSLEVYAKVTDQHDRFQALRGVPSIFYFLLRNKQIHVCRQQENSTFMRKDFFAHAEKVIAYLSELLPFLQLVSTHIYSVFHNSG